MHDWPHVRDWLGHVLALDADAWFVHLGLIVQLAAAVALRRPLRTLAPWLAALLATLAAEAARAAMLPPPGASAAIDLACRHLLAAMLVPTLLLLVARYLPRLLVGERETDEEPGLRG